MVNGWEGSGPGRSGHVREAVLPISVVWQAKLGCLLGQSVAFVLWDRHWGQAGMGFLLRAIVLPLGASLSCLEQWGQCYGVGVRSERDGSWCPLLRGLVLGGAHGAECSQL